MRVPSTDITWLLRGGGMFSGQEVPSHRFNAGEKGVFWLGVCVAGLAGAELSPRCG